MISICQLTTQQLPYALMQAMELDELPTINWELCGKLIKQEKISLVFFGTHWVAMEINPSNSERRESNTEIQIYARCGNKVFYSNETWK